ncbi:hypothetical protein [Alishewanella sp. HL-SH06]|uniref:hypothetical protein n=1 Tax=Alishewanella sp. HL-SH06 TaxID=3461144 RepID=UPI0040428405
MIKAEEYVAQTEHAVKGMFEILSYYDGLFKASVEYRPHTALRHSDNKQECQHIYEQWLNQPDINKKVLEAERISIELSASLFSRHVISGSILQIAFKAIELFSSNKEPKSECAFLFEGVDSKKRPKYYKFLVGRLIKRVPIGLIIYAGRNQYNHFDEAALKDRVNINVFEALALEDGSMFDDGMDFKNPSFDLEYAPIIVRSSIMLSALGWKTYPDYYDDIQSMFSEIN